MGRRHAPFSVFEFQKITGDKNILCAKISGNRFRILGRRKIDNRGAGLKNGIMQHAAPKFIHCFAAAAKTAFKIETMRKNVIQWAQHAIESTQDAKSILSEGEILPGERCGIKSAVSKSVIAEERGRAGDRRIPVLDIRKCTQRKLWVDLQNALQLKRRITLHRCCEGFGLLQKHRARSMRRSGHTVHVFGGRKDHEHFVQPPSGNIRLV
nr:MAG TPA: hypothetical protein [Inoviridae sp.]